MIELLCSFLRGSSERMSASGGATKLYLGGKKKRIPKPPAALAE